LVFVKGQESERLAKIMAKLNLSQALSEEEINFLVKVIEQHKFFKNKYIIKIFVIQNMNPYIFKYLGKKIDVRNLKIFLFQK
jgi:hypothetical protein